MVLVTCPSCGGRVSTAAARCPHCAVELQGGDLRGPSAAPARATPGRGRSGPLHGLLMVALGVFVFAVVVFLGKAIERMWFNG